MRLLYRDELFDAQLLRTAGHTAYGGADLGECLATARGIRETDLDGWHTAWHALAERLFAMAETSAAQGRRVSAREAFLRAANYFRNSYVFLIRAPVDARLVHAHTRQVESFRKAAALLDHPAEPVAIPYEGSLLHGYFFRPNHGSGPRPTLIVTGGYDSTAEEAYFFAAAAAVARGYNCLTYDGPGQGMAIIRDGLTFRPDWESVIAPVVDFLVSRPEVDPKRIAQIGISFGGYLAPRAATGEPRLAALIADPGDLSLLEEIKTRVPPFVARNLPDGNRWVLALVDRMMRARLNKPTAGWALRRAFWLHGVDSPMGYVRESARYTLEGLAGRIACPTLICTAENDDIGATAGRLFEALRCEKAMMKFTAAEGAGEHCEAGARTLFNQRSFDWLDRVLGHKFERAGA
jgi:alpha-beta hydrolase superfamily lysophospholipase